MIFETKINGIKCYCRVEHYSRVEEYKEGNTTCGDEKFIFTMLDHRRVIAPWLQKQVTEVEQARLLEEFHVTVLEEKYCYEHPA